MKKLVLAILKTLAKGVINRQKPIVIGVTGTVGKTTTTHFIFDFLQALYGNDVYMSPYDYNGEYGLPLTILHCKSPNKNPFLWIFVFIKGFFMRFCRKYPKYLVLEYGIDHPGEMDFMLNIVKPDYGVILNVSKNHVVQFPNFEEYVSEKLKLPLNSKNIIYNKDDQNIDNVLSKVKNKNILTYGVNSKNSDFVAYNIKSSIDSIEFNLSHKTGICDLKYNLIGEYQVYNIMPTFTLGMMMGIDRPKIKEILSNINPQKGRGTILKGANNSIIIDGSYNGGYVSITAGIDYIDKIKGDYFKILFLGDMRELGDESKKIHLNLASKIISSKVNKVVLVGEEMKKYAYEKLAQQLGEDHVYWFLSSRQAGRKIREMLSEATKQGVVFVKGSQNTIFLEEGIKEFLYDMRDSSKLCRQGAHWMKKKEDFFNNVL